MMEDFHNRLSMAEAYLRRKQRAPTVPIYDLSASPPAPAITWVVAGVDSIGSPASRAMTSVDGSTWVKLTDSGESSDGATADGLAYNGSDLVVCNGGMLLSTDLMNLADQSSPFGTGNGVVWCDSLGLFVAGGNAPFFSPPVVITSPDGVTWTTQTTPWDNGGGIGVANRFGWSHSQHLIVCAGANSAFTHGIMTSPDGVTWTQRTTPDGNQMYDVCWSEHLGLWAATGIDSPYGASIITSPDGTTWTDRFTFGSGQGSGICYSADVGLFIAVGSWGSNALLTSPDGITWTPQTVSFGEASGVAWSHSLSSFMVVAGGFGGVLTSPDGFTWTHQTALNFRGVDVIAIS